MRRTRCDRIVVFEGNPRLAGTLTQVSVHDCRPTTLIGRIVTRQHPRGGSSLLPMLQASEYPGDSDSPGHSPASPQQAR